MAKEKLILVDGSAYLYRAFHALPELMSSRGQPTGALHGVLSMLDKLIDQYKPEYFAVVFDPRGKTFRDDWYPEYKANRSSMPDDLAAQIEPLFQLIRAKRMPLVIHNGVEADDVIGTLASAAQADGLEVVISSGDKDFAQLVSDDITLVNTMDGTRLDRAGVIKKFGVPPERIIDYLTLVGDTVDNVPGVPKVGPKTAVKWLTAYGDLEQIVSSADEFKGKVGENLRASLDHLPLSKRLVTIVCDLNLEVAPRDLVIGSIDRESLISLYREFELKTLLARLLEADEEVLKQANEANYETITTQAALSQWLLKLEQAEVIAFDTETTSLNNMEAQIVGVSFAVEANSAAYVPLAHDYVGAPEQLDRDSVLTQLKPLLEDPNQAKVGHNLKYDRGVLLNHGIELRGIKFDTMLESYIFDSTATRHDMDSACRKYLGRETIHYEDVAGKGAKQITFNQVPIEVAAPYAAEDADICLQLHDYLWPKIQAQSALSDLYLNLEIPLVPVLSRVERYGVLVDEQMLVQQSSELADRMAEIEAEAHELAGGAFNIGSPKQIQQILFEQMGLPVKAKTPKGQPSTAESVLQELALDYPLPKLILEHRGVSKLKSTYTDKLPREIDPRTGRVHTSYHQAVAATGRLSSANPNLQNIPVRTQEGRRIRQAFIAPAGKILIAADYSQIELRIMAHLSSDERLLQAFAAGEDIHRATAAEVFGLKSEDVDDDQRRAAKAINFGLIYGMSAFGLARQLGIGRHSAQEYIDLYFARYPGVKAFMDETRARAHEIGYVETVFGRRLYLPEINDRNVQRRQYAERTAINAPMQGTAADIIKRAMIAVDEWIITTGVDAAVIMQVHDELVLEVADDIVAEVSDKLIELMAAAGELKVPLTVDVGHGHNWDEAH